MSVLCANYFWHKKSGRYIEDTHLCCYHASKYIQIQCLNRKEILEQKSFQNMVHYLIVECERKSQPFLKYVIKKRNFFGFFLTTFGHYIKFQQFFFFQNAFIVRLLLLIQNMSTSFLHFEKYIHKENSGLCSRFKISHFILDF